MHGAAWRAAEDARRAEEARAQEAARQAAEATQAQREALRAEAATWDRDARAAHAEWRRVTAATATAFETSQRAEMESFLEGCRSEVESCGLPIRRQMTERMVALLAACMEFRDGQHKLITRWCSTRSSEAAAWWATRGQAAQAFVERFATTSASVDGHVPEVAQAERREVARLVAQDVLRDAERVYRLSGIAGGPMAVVEVQLRLLQQLTAAIKAATAALLTRQQAAWRTHRENWSAAERAASEAWCATELQAVEARRGELMERAERLASASSPQSQGETRGGQLSQSAASSSVVSAAARLAAEALVWEKATLQAAAVEADERTRLAEQWLHERKTEIHDAIRAFTAAVSQSVGRKTGNDCLGMVQHLTQLAQDVTRCEVAIAQTTSRRQSEEARAAETRLKEAVNAAVDEVSTLVATQASKCMSAALLSASSEHGRKMSDAACRWRERQAREAAQWLDAQREIERAQLDEAHAAAVERCSRSADWHRVTPEVRKFRIRYNVESRLVAFAQKQRAAHQAWASQRVAAAEAWCKANLAQAREHFRAQEAGANEIEVRLVSSVMREVQRDDPADEGPAGSRGAQAEDPAGPRGVRARTTTSGGAQAAAAASLPAEEAATRGWQWARGAGRPFVRLASDERARLLEQWRAVAAREGDLLKAAAQAAKEAANAAATEASERVDVAAAEAERQAKAAAPSAHAAKVAPRPEKRPAPRALASEAEPPMAKKRSLADLLLPSGRDSPVVGSGSERVSPHTPSTAALRPAHWGLAPMPGSAPPPPNTLQGSVLPSDALEQWRSKALSRGSASASTTSRGNACAALPRRSFTTNLLGMRKDKTSSKPAGKGTR